MRRDRIVQLGFGALALLALAAAGMLQGPIERQRERHKLVTVSSGEAIAKHPKIALMQIVPGGVRAPFITYLWVRSQRLKEDGKFFDAEGLRNLICEMMPHFSGVWAFHAWDMAWNISVATHTDDERWMWVSNGLELIRDKGLYYNPDDLLLYKELAWIYFSKMGQYTDEMHRVYKQRWAEEMDWVLGAPPPAGTTAEVIDAFRPIAEAPATLETLSADPKAKAFLDRLAEFKIAPGEELLRYYNRLGGDPLAGNLDPAPKGPANDREREVARLLKDKALAEGREKVVAFARRKVLVEKYRLDPAWMLALMEKYGPMDWRHVNAHAIYWATLGLHLAAGMELAEIHAGVAEAKALKLKTEELDLYEITRLNTERIILGALKSLSRTGQLFVRRREPVGEKQKKALIYLDWTPDWRFIEPAHQEYVAGGAALTGSADKLDAESNSLRNGHVTYLEDVVLQLFFGQRMQLARHYFRELVNRLKPNQEIYKRPGLTLRQFVRAKLKKMGLPPSELARTFWTGGLRSAYLALAGGQTSQFQQYRAFAYRAYRVYARDISHAQRLRPPPFGIIERDFLVVLFLRPQAVQAKLPLLGKSRLYKAIATIRVPAGGRSVTLQQVVYPAIAEALRKECRKEGIDFDAAFPAPAALPQRQPSGPASG